MDDPILLTVEEASRILGFGRSRTYALIAAGVLPSLKIGRSIRVSRRQLEQWVEGLPQSTPGKDGHRMPHGPSPSQNRMSGLSAGEQ